MSLSFRAMKVTCLPSTMQNLAGWWSVCLNFASCDIDAGICAFFGTMNLTLIPLFFAFCSAFLSASAFLPRPSAEVIMLTLFCAFFIAEEM